MCRLTMRPWISAARSLVAVNGRECSLAKFVNSREGLDTGSRWTPGLSLLYEKKNYLIN